MPRRLLHGPLLPEDLNLTLLGEVLSHSAAAQLWLVTNVLQLSPPLHLRLLLNHLGLLLQGAAIISPLQNIYKY